MAKFDFLIGNHRFGFSFEHRLEGEEYVSGVTNKCADGRYCLFLDYDDVPYDWVVEELRFLIDDFGLGDVHVFRTNKGFHAICTTKYCLREVVEVMRSSSIDAAYLDVPLREAKKLWTLRTSAKGGKVPVYLVTLPGSHVGEESHAHNEILRKLYNINIPRMREDKSEQFITGHYYVRRS